MDWALPPGFGFHYRIYIAADSLKADTQRIKTRGGSRPKPSFIIMESYLEIGMQI
jgi:hypothetical protein